MRAFTKKLSMLVAVALSVQAMGCAAILGFKEFTEEEGGDGDGDGGDSCSSEDDCSGNDEMCVSGTCQNDCDAGEYFCSGELLQLCNEEGDGVVGDGERCESAGLCQLAVDDGEESCAEPVCVSGQAKCTGGSGDLFAEECTDDLSSFAPVDDCTNGLQCNPGAGSCFELKIDETEVTRAAYEDFAAGDRDSSEQEAGCEWNESFVADAECMAESSVCEDDGEGSCDEHPQVCVDWCDAAAYCEWKGQRLCGAIETGDLVDFEEGYADPGESEWMNGCSAAGQFKYVSGNGAPESDPQACTFKGRLDSTYAVASRDGCSSPGRGYTGLFDLSGNVAEWTNNCTTAVSKPGDGADTACRARGGSFASELRQIACDAATSIAQARSTADPTIGFRCCSD